MRNASEAVINRVATPSTPLAFYQARSTGPSRAKVGGEPLILGHALGSNRNMWDEVLTLLPSNLEVILWEQPGHGQSGLLAVEEPSALDTAKAIGDGLDDLGVSRGHFAGLSLGGMTTLAFAQRYPGLVASFAVLDSDAVSLPSAQWLDKALLVETQGLEGLVEGTMGRWFTSSFAKGEGANAVQRIRQIFLETNPAGYAQCCRILAHTDLRPQLSAATSPAMILTGDQDPGMTPDQAHDLAGLLPTPVEVVVVEDAAHLTAVQHPHVVTHALLNLIETVSA